MRRDYIYRATSLKEGLKLKKIDGLKPLRFHSSVLSSFNTVWGRSVVVAVGGFAVADLLGLLHQLVELDHLLRRQLLEHF